MFEAILFEFIGTGQKLGLTSIGILQYAQVCFLGTPRDSVSGSWPGRICKFLQQNSWSYESYKFNWRHSYKQITQSNGISVREHADSWMRRYYMHIKKGTTIIT